MGLARVNLTAEPDMEAHMMTGSVPTLSLVAVPDEVGAVPGKVTGMVAPQRLPSVVTVTAVMVLPSLE